MRWRPAFMAEVFGWLQQLGLTACPQCGSANSLRTSPVPVRLAESGAPPPGGDGRHPGPDREGDVIFAINVGCAACGHSMLFNAARYRTVDDTIIEGWPPRAQEE